MIVLLLSILLLIFIVLTFYYRKRFIKVKFQKQSLSTKYGKMTEQFMPFLEVYPYDKNNFRFIGTPIDGIQFENDKIIFIEFKSANSKLTEKQKKIKELVKNGRVEFEEFKINSL